MMDRKDWTRPGEAYSDAVTIVGQLKAVAYTTVSNDSVSANKEITNEESRLSGHADSRV